MKSFVLGVMEQYGYPGIFFLILLENLFPPIPSEVILPFGGFLTIHTGLTLAGTIFFSTLGSLAGAAALYGVGRILDEKKLRRLVSGRVGKVLRLKEEDIGKADDWFRKKGKKAVFFCRCVPVIRSLISIPAGMSCMALPEFFLYTAAGTVIWNTLLISLGAFMGESWEYITFLAGEYSHVMLIILGISACSAYLGFRGKRKNEQKNNGTAK